MHDESRQPHSARLTVDEAGVVLETEPSVARLLGENAVVGADLRRFLDCSVSAEVIDYLSGQHRHAAVFDSASDCVALRIVVRPDAQRGRYVVDLENVTAARARLRRLHLTEATIDRVTDMIIWLDREGRYVFVNAAASRLLGYTAEELSRLRVVDVDPLFDEDIWRRHWQEIVERQSFVIETVNTTKDGTDIPIEVTVNYVNFDGEEYNCSIVRDITERKVVESRLLQLNEEITRLSVTDDLTGIANRRRFDAVLAEFIDSHTRTGDPLSVIMIDIDHFKVFNDHLGHAAGDECLRRVAEVLDHIAAERRGLAARYGGEEFLCLLPRADESVAADVALQCQTAIARLEVAHPASSTAATVTVSAGVLTCRHPFDTAAILAGVDAQLYRAKREGRNRVVSGPDTGAGTRST
ncbi:MAG: diguanylate cyclase [Mycobacterium kyogaense]|uniref:GGDEF domain-containing protein n=1 Tax=Mycobacterium kyogaense TaxID=2212479 RepID=UPI002FF65A72